VLSSRASIRDARPGIFIPRLQTPALRYAPAGVTGFFYRICTALAPNGGRGLGEGDFSARAGCTLTRLAPEQGLATLSRKQERVLWRQLHSSLREAQQTAGSGPTLTLFV